MLLVTLKNGMQVVVEAGYPAPTGPNANAVAVALIKRILAAAADVVDVRPYTE